MEHRMCLAVPMRVVSIAGHCACCEARGISRDVSLFLLAEGTVTPGDYVLVHVGHAIQTITLQDSEASWALFDQITAQHA
jgi:hydrogenase expression/formation protein HypC